MELARAIDQAATMPLAEMGQRGRAWMEQDYSWAKVAGEMIAEYERVLQNLRPRQVEVAPSPETA